MLRNDAGLTVVEVMVASFITLFGLASLLVAFTSAARLTAIQSAETDAVHEIRELTERLLACEYYETELSIGTHSIDDGLDSFYTVEYNSDTSLYGSENVKDVHITKYWLENSGSVKSSYEIEVSMARVMH